MTNGHIIPILPNTRKLTDEELKLKNPELWEEAKRTARLMKNEILKDPKNANLRKSIEWLG